MDSVTAKPLTGPDPKIKRIIDAMSVVIFASKIVTTDLLKPKSKA